MLEFLRKWWWPAFVVIYSFVFSFNPDRQTFVSTNAMLKSDVLIFGVIFGILLQLINQKNARLSDIQKLPIWLWKNKIFLLTFIMFILILLSALLSPQPAVSLMGSLLLYLTSTFSYLGFIVVAWLIAIWDKKDTFLTDRIAYAFIFCGSIFSVLGMIEVVIEKPLFVPILAKTYLPIVVFGGGGFLAGFCMVSSVLAAYLYTRKPSLILGVAFIVNVILIGLTGNRGSVLALFISLIILLFANLKNLKTHVQPLLVTLLLIPALWYIISILHIGAQDPTRFQTVSLRQTYAKISIAGMIQKPLIGWGSGQFFWWKQLPEPELIKFIRAEYLSDQVGIGKLLYYNKNSSLPEDTIFFFDKVDEKGIKSIHKVQLANWSGHNFFLDSGVFYGVFCLILIIIGLIYFFIRVFNKDPFFYVLVSLSIYLITWYASPEILIIFWMMWGLLMRHTYTFFNKNNKLTNATV